jgi:membrane-bound lytic murein transglycosylase D
LKLTSSVVGIASLGVALLLAGCASPSAPTSSVTSPTPAIAQPVSEALAPLPSSQPIAAPPQAATAQIAPPANPIRLPSGGLAMEPHADVWARMRAGFAMADLDTPLVAEKVRFYLSNREALNRMFQRGGRYLYFIVDEVERRGMPTELALLPFVESAMNPVALSSAKAAGLWQFIPSTGKQYELSQNWWVDNRRDVVQSTRAALDYLQKIYEMNERDWFLALASYNWGENAVARAVRNNRARGMPVDYLSLSMPAETRHYVPKLIALKLIIQRAAEYGVVLPDVPNRPYFITVEKTRPIDLKLAAQFAGMSVEEFVALNPAHNRPVIAASRNNQIKLPADRVDVFMASVARHDLDAKPLASWQPYTLKPGETLDDVARNGNVSTQEIIRANSLRAGARIMPGTQVIAPQPSVRDQQQVESFPGPRVYEQITTSPVYHRVAKRESLAGIAASYGVSADTLRAWNGGIKSAKPGASLLVRPASSQTVLTVAGGTRQVVSRDEAPAFAAAPIAVASPPVAAPAPAQVDPVAVIASAAAVTAVARTTYSKNSAATSRTQTARAEPPQAKGRAASKTAATQTVARGPGSKKDKLATGAPTAKGKYPAAQPMTAVLKPSDKAPATKGTARTTTPPPAKGAAPAKSNGKAART